MERFLQALRAKRADALVRALLAGALLGACSARSVAPAERTRAGDPAQSEVRISAPPSVQALRACTPIAPETCFDARDDNCNGIIDEGCGVGTGLVQFVIAWSEPLADVDLNVSDPGGELASVGRRTERGFIKERDCPGRSGAECHGQNFENVYLTEGAAPPGRYVVRIRLEKLNGASTPVAVTLGARVGGRTYGFELELREAEEEREIIFSL